MICRRSRNLTNAISRCSMRKSSDAVIDSLRPMESFTRRLIIASAASDVSYNHRDAAKLWTTIPQAGRTNTPPPSMDKSSFLAQNNLLPGTDPSSPDHESLNDPIRPGTFVELRRNNIITHGIVLQLQVLEARRHSLTLTYTGEIWPHLVNDIAYVIPNFVSQDLLERAGGEYEAHSTAQAMARLQIVEQIRTFTRQHERHFNSISKTIFSLYDDIRHRDPDRWIDVTTPIATTFMDTRNPPPVLTLFAMHTQLMSRPIYYVADPRNHRTTNRFAVRPLSHVQDLLPVNEWVRSRDPVFKSFVQKGRQVIRKFREAQEKYWDASPSRVDDGFIPWSPSDLTFIRFLQNSLRTARTIQEDPYELAISSLGKAMAKYPDHVIGSGLSQLMLVELGVMAPWEDVVCRMPELRLDIAPPSESKEVQTIEEVVQHSLEKPTTPMPSTVHRKLRDIDLDGSTGLLQQDPLESQRRDFHDMPVYVVDDMSAQELDDGLSIEEIPGEPANCWVHIHIADPTSLIPPGHVLDLRARKAVVTFYSSHRTWAMLPSSLTQPLFSLGAKSKDEGQKVLTFSIKLNDNAEFLDYHIQASLVRNVRILTYDQVDNLLGLRHSYYSYPFPTARQTSSPNNPISEKHHSDLRRLHTLGDRLFRRTLEQHPVINFTFPKATINFQEKLPMNPIVPNGPTLWKGYPSMTYVVDDQEQLPHSFRQVIAEFMKLAGRAASRFCQDNGLPALRRASKPMEGATPTDTEYLLSLRGPTGFVDAFECIKRDLYAPPGEPTLAPLAHWGLGIPEGEGYTRVTSPLRRYGDLIMHWQIQHALLRRNKGPLFSAEYLKPIMHQLHERERGMIAAELTYRRHWALAYLARHIRDEKRKHGTSYEPFPKLLARTTASVGFDTVRAQSQVSVVIPRLGVQGELRGVDDRVPLPIGTAIDVKVEDFKLGVPSVLQLKLA